MLFVCGLCAVAGDDFVVFAFAPAAEGIVFAERMGLEAVQVRMRRRSGWPSKTMPNMSNTSRSIQSAPFQIGMADGMLGDGSLTNALTQSR